MVEELKNAPRSVAPRVGVWIEIISSILNNAVGVVAPRVGVWIEMATLKAL